MSGPRQLTYEYKDVAFAPYGDHVRDMRKLFILELLSMRRVQAAWDARVAQVDQSMTELQIAILLLFYISTIALYISNITCLNQLLISW